MLWHLFHLPGKFGFYFGIPAASHAVAFAHHLGGIADKKKVFTFGGKVARDLAATGYDRPIWENGSLAYGAAITYEDIVADSYGKLTGMDTSRVEVGEEMEIGVEQLAFP